jgi:5'-3' exonuclease
MLKHLQPQLGAVFWDEGLPQRRVELQPAYKETRKEMPRPMIPQLDFHPEHDYATAGIHQRRAALIQRRTI